MGVEHHETVIFRHFETFDKGAVETVGNSGNVLGGFSRQHGYSGEGHGSLRKVIDMRIIGHQDNPENQIIQD
jgi:hypothetical protein